MRLEIVTIPLVNYRIESQFYCTRIDESNMYCWHGCRFLARVVKQRYCWRQLCPSVRHTGEPRLNGSRSGA